MEATNPIDATPPMPSTRAVRLERWRLRTFFVVPCPFHVDLPLDMSGCLRAAVVAAERAGHRPIEGAPILASDVRGAGAIFVEVDRPELTDERVVTVTGEILVRALADDATRAGILRRDVDELMRWACELGHDVCAFFVGFTRDGEAFRPGLLLAHLDGDLVEHFEVASTRRYVVREVELVLDASP